MEEINPMTSYEYEAIVNQRFLWGYENASKAFDAVFIHFWFIEASTAAITWYWAAPLKERRLEISLTTTDWGWSSGQHEFCKRKSFCVLHFGKLLTELYLIVHLFKDQFLIRLKNNHINFLNVLFNIKYNLFFIHNLAILHAKKAQKLI